MERKPDTRVRGSEHESGNGDKATPDRVNRKAETLHGISARCADAAQAQPQGRALALEMLCHRCPSRDASVQLITPRKLGSVCNTASAPFTGPRGCGLAHRVIDPMAHSMDATPNITASVAGPPAKQR